MTFLRSVRLERDLLCLWTAFCSEEWGYNCNVGRTNWTCSGLSCLIFPCFFFFPLPLAASTHDWDFPADKVLASLRANLLLAKPALWPAGCAVSFDANRTRVCHQSIHLSLFTSVGWAQGESQADGFHIPSGIIFSTCLVIFEYSLLFWLCLDFTRSRPVEEVRGIY